MSRRKIVVEISYDDDADNPRQISLVDHLTGLGGRLEHHLSTPVDVWILSDQILAVDAHTRD